MLIQMTGTWRGSDNGFDVRRFRKYEFLEVGEQIGQSLASAFLHEGKAQIVDAAVVDKLIACPYLNQWKETI